MSVVEKIFEDAKDGFAAALKGGKIDSGAVVRVVTGIVGRVIALPIEAGDKKAFVTLVLKKASEAAGVSGSDGFAAVLDKVMAVGHELIDSSAKVSAFPSRLSLLSQFLSKCLPLCFQVAVTTSALDPKDTELVVNALKEAQKGLETVESILESLTVKVSESGERLVEVGAPASAPASAPAAALVEEVQEDIPLQSISEKESSPEASPLEVPVLNLRTESLD
jgi:hypothetical protein